jgi:hypothetical protein
MEGKWEKGKEMKHDRKTLTNKKEEDWGNEVKQ